MPGFMRRWLMSFVAVTAGLVALGGASVVLAAAEGESSLVTVQQGELPIVISAPHGGREAVDGVEPRTPSESAGVITVREDNTAELAEKLAEELERRLQKKPYLIIARFERKYIDANRPAESAYDNDAAKPHYDAFHKAVEEACRDVANKFQGGLLLDIHGQSSKPDEVLRGTSNGKTVKLLVERHGQAALIGPKSLMGLLAADGYDVLPKVDSDDNEEPKYTGGHIVRTYGSGNPGGIDAIQLEFGRKYRVPLDRAEETAEDLAEAVVAFSKEYLPAALK